MLFATTLEARIAQFRRRADKRPIGDIVRDPAGEAWMDVEGERVAFCPEGG